MRSNGLLWMVAAGTLLGLAVVLLITSLLSGKGVEGSDLALLGATIAGSVPMFVAASKSKDGVCGWCCLSRLAFWKRKPEVAAVPNPYEGPAPRDS